jgi:aryl-alcohol dehydrogenase-like predicted oxidoreductase
MFADAGYNLGGAGVAPPSDFDSGARAGLTGMLSNGPHLKLRRGHMMIAKQPFGRTGHLSTRALFGAAALSDVSQADADRTLEVLLAYGVNHIDTAASYGEAELRIGPWMDQHRQQFFLATKTGERTYQKARDEVHRSLERLRVGQVDLLQLHNLVDPHEWQVAMGPGGALEAAVEAREQGLVRFIGVTGHGVTVAAMHRRALERFDFDSVLLPYSIVLMQNPQYAADFEALIALCQDRNVAVQTIKTITRRPWGDQRHTRATWYEPLEDQADIDLAVHWVLSRPGLFLNTAGDIDLLPKVLDAASRFAAHPSAEAAEALVERRAMAPLFT